MSDVYCFGHVSTGVILRLKGAFPKPDGYAEIAETLVNHAGEATGSSLVLAKLGVSVRLEGNWIGDTPACRATLAFLRSRQIDCSGLVVKPGYEGVNEVVVSDGHSRTVFGRYADLLFTKRQWEMPSLASIRSARVTCVDPSFGKATLLVAHTARKAGIPVVTCDTRPDSPLAAASDVIAVSNEFMAREYPAAVKGKEARKALFHEYLERCPGLTVFTDGSRPLWYGRGYGAKHAPGHSVPGETMQMAPFKIEIVDSAGAGDSFRGGLIYGMLQGWSDQESIRFASAVAALICTTAPGCVNPPSLAQVKRLLARK